MGWDTIDELLAQYNNWEVKVDTNLVVKHLRPTASTYSNKSKYMQGGMFYRIRYGFILSMIASMKLAYKKKSISLLFDYIKGYFKASKNKESYLVTEKEGKWIRKYRWKNIFHKFSILKVKK